METPKLPTLQKITINLPAARLAVFLLALVLIIAAAAVAGGQILNKDQEHDTVLVARLAGDYIDSASQAIRFLAADFPLQKDLEAFQGSTPLFDVLYVIGKNGQLDEMAPPNPAIQIGMDMSSQAVFNPALNSLAVSDPFISAQTGNPTVTISAPLANKGGILVGELSLKGLQENIAGTNKNQIGIIFVVDQNGYLLVHPDYEKVRRQENIRNLGIMEQIQTRQTFHIYFTGLEPVVSHIQPIPQTGWWAVNQMSFAAVYGSFLLPALGGLALVTLLFVIFTYQEQLSVIRKIVTPLYELGSHAQRMAAGTYKSDEALLEQAPHYAEVSSLADSFKRMEQAVQSREDALLLSENRYRRLFEDSPVSLLEQDFSDIKTYLDKLRETGITDWWDYFDNHPQEMRDCADRAKILNVNKAALDMLNFNQTSESLGRLGMILVEKSYAIFKEELISLAEGNLVFEAENVYRTFENTAIYASVRLIILPGYEATWSKVLVSLSDITERKHAENAIQESEGNFRTFFETIDDMILVSTVDGRIMYSNAAITDKLGYDFVEFYGMYLLELYPQDKRSEIEENFATMLRGERASCLLPLQTKNGTLIPVETRVWSGNWDGVDCVFSACKDLRAEQEAQQRFEHIFRSNPNLMTLSSLDGRFSDVNDAFLQTLGYSRVEVIGNTAEELTLFTQLEQYFDVGKELARRGRIQNVELKIRRKDGRLLDGLFNVEIIESQGQINLLIVIVDISELKQVELALALERNLLRTLIDNIPDPIYAMDRQGRKTLTNAADLAFMGLNNEAEALGKTDAELYLAEQAADLLAVDALVLNHNQSFLGFEELVQDAAGKKHWLLTSKTPLHSPDGAVSGLVGIGRDITGLKEAEEKLREMAVTDDLTGLNNRRGFMILAAQQLKIADRTRDSLILFFADLDGLKGINDTLGHKEGDQMLVDAATVLKQIFRSADILARLGGDEFVSLVIEANSNAKEVIMERLQHHIDAHNLQTQRAYKLSMSIGTARFDPQNPDSLDSLLTQADANMYEQKKAKKNQSIDFTDSAQAAT